MIPQTVYCYFWAYPFLLFSFSVLQFSVVVCSVRQFKLTHVGFRAYVKIASRIVSYRSVHSVKSRSQHMNWTMLNWQNLSEHVQRSHRTNWTELNCSSSRTADRDIDVKNVQIKILKTLKQREKNKKNVIKTFPLLSVVQLHARCPRNGLQGRHTMRQT